MLKVSAGFATAVGKREHNEDFVGLSTPDGESRVSHGLIVALADGVGGNAGGREAAEYAVRGLLSDYYATPETWEVSQSLDKVICAINRWVQSQASQRKELAGMASTLTVLVTRGRWYYFAHVGDTRLYLYRNQQLKQLTVDHVWEHPELQHVLTRAIGLDSHLVIDHGAGELQVGDVFLLVCDGVWGVLPRFDIEELLHRCAVQNTSVQPNDPQHTADLLIQSALLGASQDNVSAAVMRVDDLPDSDARDTLAEQRNLPVPSALHVGEKIDGLIVEAVLHQSANTCVYKVRDPNTERLYALKCLTLSRADDALECAAFAQEEWLTRRVVARFFAQYVPWPTRSYAYFLTTWHEGNTLAEKLSAHEHFTVPEVIAWSAKLARALGALHRRGVLHRDIKPENIHIGVDQELRVLDLGIAVSGANPDRGASNARAGTQSYLAPELFEDATPNTQTDLYSVGVTIYHLLTRKFPYGEIEPFQRPKFGEPTALTRYRPEIPHWLENLVLKSVAKDPSQRFETAEELLVTIERGALHPVTAPAAEPLSTRTSLTAWRWIATLSLLGNLIVLLWAFVR
jgi:serine/threonine protein phosphatase PrpC